MYHVDFLNKNTFRNYPLRSGGVIVSEEGITLPTALLSSIQFSVPVGYTHVFISRIYVNSNYLNILIAGKVGSVVHYLGFFDGTVTEDFQQLKWSSLLDTVFGSMLIGRSASLIEYQGTHTFTEVTGRVEDSLVTVVVAPTLTSINHDGIKLTGQITFSYNNVREIANTTKLQLEVINKETIRAVNDLSSQFGNCATPPIGSINGVLPDENGNIDIFGIAPVTIEIDAMRSGISLITTPTISRSELCADIQQIPDLIKTSYYLQNIGPTGGTITTLVPEWLSWSWYKNT